MADHDDETATKIRTLNDDLRKHFRGGKILLTASVNELPETVRAQALREMAAFDNFNAANDPYNEHDFGSFEFCGRNWIWKIDYYDPSFQFASDDPSDPQRTERVLTLMLAEDY